MALKSLQIIALLRQSLTLGSWTWYNIAVLKTGWDMLTLEYNIKQLWQYDRVAEQQVLGG